MKVVAGEVFSLALFYLPFLSKLAFTSGYTPPADKEQESGWREEGEGRRELGPALPELPPAAELSSHGVLVPPV